MLDKKERQKLAQTDTHALQNELDQIGEKCKSCKLCQKECAFLQKYGSPKKIAANFNFSSQKDGQISFQCSLCKLCTAVCPFEADPAAMFLEMRRYSNKKGCGELAEHTKLLNFEKRGTSKRYTFYTLPSDCTTVLFPGCSLSATRSAIVKRLFSHLETKYKNLGLVLDCCSKPSHDLGRHGHFLSMFREMTQFLTQHGIAKVLVACPSCYSVFKTYGEGIETKSVYEEIVDIGLPADSKGSCTQAAFHDSCTARFEDTIQSSVRTLATQAGLDLHEMPHHGSRALCCGEGGGACYISPEFISNWKIKRRKEMSDRLVLTYCSGCANFIGSKKTSHILDMIFSPEIQKGKKAKVAKAPFTYLHRLALKRWAKKNIKTKISRERTFPLTR